MGDMVKFCDKLLKKDPEALKLRQGLLESMPTMRGEPDYDMFEFIKNLHGEYRTIVSDGFLNSLKHIRKYVPLRYNLFKSGDKAWTWTIPPKWTVNSASIVNRRNDRKILDLKNSPLHVPAYSAPIDAVVSHEELMGHIFYREDLPDAVPYRWKIFNRDWGFSIKAGDLPLFDADSYKVKIDSKFEDGYMVVGEYTVKGYGDKSIIFPIHLDHPSQSNDNLSGCSAAIELILKLLRTTDLKYSYKFLFLPETIGTIAYLSKNESIIPSIKYGIVFDSIGNDAGITLTRAKDPLSMLNGYAVSSVKRHCRSFSVNDFFDDSYLASANDERVLQAPLIGIPSIHLSRAPFKEYHTDKDCIDIIRREKLSEVVDIVYEIIGIIERDAVPEQKYKGILCLSEHGLWDNKWTAGDSIIIEKILHLISSDLSIFQIAERINTSFDFVYDFIKKLETRGLVKLSDLR